ncbi:MAG: hypothetical protein Q3990_08450, partial [Desulfovibrionaceae bacterium]|nr:hypothetical protein [Desulfovibrionaceae bacterium]
MDMLDKVMDQIPDFVFQFFADKNPIEIGLFGPSRIGKTTLIASMMEEFKAYTDKLAKIENECLILDAEETTKKILSRKKNELSLGIGSKSFKVGSLSSTSSHETFELRLSSPGDDGFNPIIRLNDFPGGWITDPDRLKELKIKDWSIVIIPVDAAVIMESRQKKQMLLARELLGVNHVEDFVRTWLSMRNGQPGLCIFAPVKCETYFTLPPMASNLRDQSQVLLNRTREYYGGAISQLENKDYISCLYMPVNTIGCCSLKISSWSDSEFNAVYSIAPYSIDGQSGNKWLPYGPANIILELCKFIAEIIRHSSINIRAYRHF